jgi:hypothetical protein
MIGYDTMSKFIYNFILIRHDLDMQDRRSYSIGMSKKYLVKKTRGDKMKKGMILFIGLGLVFLMSAAQANMKEMKTYKEAFPGASIKCIDCHVDTMPKKDEGKHEPNDYGKAVIAKTQKTSPTADTYKAVGKIEDFKKK